MMPFADIAVRFVIAVLFNGLWIAALVAAAAWIALRAMPNANATTRHSMLAAALYAAVILPIVVAGLTVRPLTGAVVSPASIPVASHASAVSQRVAVTSGKRATAENPAVTVPVRSALSLSRPMLSLPRPAAIAIVAAWLLGAAFVLLRLLLSLHHLERLKTDALPVPIEYRARLARWTDATKGARDVRLCRSDEIVVPIAVGLFDAMILVPERLLEELPPEDVDSIVLHELAHLRRGDDWINAVERVAQALLFFNPGIRWLVAQLDIEREVACDDWVLQRNKPLPYATCLARIVESVAWPYRAISAPGAFVTRRGMSVRIERLLAAHRDVRVRTSVGPAGVTIAVLGALCLAAAFVAPSIAYTTGVAQTHASAKATQATLALAVGKAHMKPRDAVRTASVAQTGAAASPAAKPAPASARMVHAVPHPAQASLPRTAATHAQSASAPIRARQANASVAEGAPHAATLAPNASSASQARADDASGPPVAAVSASVGTAIDLATKVSGSTVARSVVVAANSPDYIDSLSSVGYSNLSIDDLIRLKAVGVTADYIRGIENAGYAHPSVEELIRLRAVGVTPAYLSAMAGAGYPRLTIEQVTQLRAMGIDANFVAKAAAHGMHNLTVDQLVRLKASGVL